MRRKVRVVGYPEITRTTDRQYTHAIVLEKVDINTGEKSARALAYCSRIDLAVKQLSKSSRLARFFSTNGNYRDVRTIICEVEEVQ